MAKHENFYENLKEAKMRLQDTVVMYDGEPHYVLSICDHKKDGVFRIYLDHLGNKNGMALNNYNLPMNYIQEAPSSPTHGDKWDEFIDKYPEAGVLRKMMNSPLFNNFRPFPLGMVNYKGETFFVERQPVRPSTHQGLTSSMLIQKPVTFIASPRNGVEFYSPAMYDCIKGNYPSIEETIKSLTNPHCQNTAAAFHRNFALVRGPIGSLYLAYKSDIIGFLSDFSLNRVKLGKEFKYTKEVVEDLGVFKEIDYA